MPNWCHNILIVSGDSAALDAFAEKARPTPELMRQAYNEALDCWRPADGSKPTLEQWFGEHCAEQPLTFEAFAPLPAGADWYSWCSDNWGTKWDARFDAPGVALGLPGADVEASVAQNGLTRIDDVLTYRFDTAWSPPIAAVDAMAAQHPTLAFTLRFAEVGSELAGQATFADGEYEDEVVLELGDVLGPGQMWY